MEDYSVNILKKIHYTFFDGMSYMNTFFNYKIPV